MSIEIPLLETKLYAPAWRATMVSRPRLLERMAQGLGGRLTLVSAPPGFGKTTLLAEWVAGASAGAGAVGWVSLDAGDNDPAVFWSYVLEALLTVRPDLGERSRALLDSPQPPPIETVLTPLLNEIGATGDPLVLVLDDYHVIDAPPVHDGIVFLLDHMPSCMHLVLASRSDPPLALARLRARRELTEVRSADLRFTSDEATCFLNRVMGLELSSSKMAALEERTEGWIAGLQLAALSMQGRADMRGFMAGFSGDNRHIADYLVEEVLQGQPERLRSFLLDTSILDRLTGPLCDAMRDLLRHAVAAGIGGAYARRLLAGCDNAPAGDEATSLTRPLTPREVEIMRLIAAGLRTAEIADRLFISPATVKRHIANAFDKLEVNHRVAAVARAYELNLL